MYVCASLGSSVDADEPEEDISFIWSLFDLEASDVDLDSFLDTLSTDMSSEGKSEM